MTASLQFVQDKISEFNELCFEGKLPPVEIKLSKAKSYLGKVTYKAKRGFFGRLIGYEDFRIWISTSFDLEENELEDVILHEMIHYYIALNKIKDTSSHGKIFRVMMKDINSKWGRNIKIRYKITALPPN